ncbi:wolframin isoform X2 [Nematostella vectensis]|uniref:wolframin isoform X2 n=1 Tax=Nematostella vectensis TaxID=45351 RepID=UPI002077892B|nr:wolframin isoform X2 [Nematostella vectensis]
MDEESDPIEATLKETLVTETEGIDERIDNAKKLLSEDSRKEDAVKILIKTSKAGSHEATDLVRKCLENGDGITDETRPEAVWCVDTPESEKHMKFAISELFETLKGKGRDRVSAGDIGKAIKDAKVKLQVVQYPYQSFESFKHYILLNISQRGSAWVKSLIPTAQIQTLMLLYLYNQLTPEMLWFIIPLIVFFIAVTGLVVFSMQMFYGREALKQLKSVSELMKKFDPMIDEKAAETKFMWKSIRPYISFFICLLITVAVFPLCDKSWIPCSELSLVALFFTVSALRGLPSDYDDYAMYTIGIKVLTTILQSLSDVKWLRILCQPFISIPVPYGMELHIGLPSILHVVILAMLVVMAGRHSWKGVYKVVIPHLVCLMWWQLFTILFDHTTWRSLGRASLGWVILITMLPLLLVYVLGIVFLNFLQWFLTLDLAMRLAVAAITICISTVVVLNSNTHLPENIREKKKAIFIGVAAVVACLFVPMLYASYVPASEGPLTDLMPWDRYDELCGPPAWPHQNEASLQAKCSEFTGAMVKWSGKVTSIRAGSVENKFRSFVMAMPTVMRPTLRCLLSSEDDDESEDKSESSGWLFSRRSSSDPCSLMSFDRYTFVMGVAMTSSTGTLVNLKVTVPHGFYHSMMTMNTSTLVTVQGYLEGGLGQSSIFVSLRRLYIGGERVRPRGVVHGEDVFSEIKNAARYSVSFFFSPLINHGAEPTEPEDHD